MILSIQLKLCRIKNYLEFVTPNRLYYKAEVHGNFRDAIGNRRVKMFLGLAIISTIITVVLILVVIFMRKRIKLVIVLFQEAGKAATSMPLLIFEPILVRINCK